MTKQDLEKLDAILNEDRVELFSDEESANLLYFKETAIDQDYVNLDPKNKEQKSERFEI